MIELNERNIQIEEIDSFKENYYDAIVEYSQIHASNISWIDEKVKFIIKYII